MKKVLVLGASGMLGHRVFLDFQEKFETFGTLRGPTKEFEKFGQFKNLLTGVDAFDQSCLQQAFETAQPDYVVNCVGGIKQHKEMPASEMIEVNSVLPWRLSELASQYKSRLIQISTDCVFDGVKGFYTENDTPNATDVYGRSKFLGEIADRDHVLTLRTSIIGRELKNGLSLVEWFLSQDRGAKIKGFSEAIYSGFPTHTMARIIAEVIEKKDFIHGLYNISSEPINKFELLQKINKQFEKEIEITPVDSPKINRALVSQKVWEKLQMEISLNWDDLIEDLKIDFEKYESLKSLR